jgi:hypothetical protein
MMGRYDPTAVKISQLRAAGIKPTEVRHTGGGHHEIYFNLNGKGRFIVCAHSPSDWRAEQNNRSVVRRIINQKEKGVTEW